MMQDNYPNINDRKPLFPGGSCFPLSPDNSGAKNTSGMPYYPNDQLNVIFDVIGTPNEEDISFLTDLKAQSYLKSFLIFLEFNIKTLPEVKYSELNTDPRVDRKLTQTEQ